MTKNRQCFLRTLSGTGPNAIFGRIVQATDPNGRTVLSLDPLGRPASETRLAGRGYSTVLSLLERPRDAFGRPAGLRLEFESDFRQSVCYTWGMDGRLSGMILSNAQDRAVEVFFESGYWDEGGDLVAEYAYDAFGNTISATGPMADVFPHRFSTKYYDAETDLYYYGYRYYSPSLGRWISRDPIKE